MQFANLNHGKEWGNKVASIGRWYKPYGIRAGKTCPDRTQEKEEATWKRLRTRKKSFAEQRLDAAEMIAEIKGQGSDLMVTEFKNGEGDVMVQTFIADAKAVCGDDWFEQVLDDVIVEVASLQNWDGVIQDEGGLFLFQLIASSAYMRENCSREHAVDLPTVCVFGAGGDVRKRISSKRQRPFSYACPQETDPNDEDNVVSDAKVRVRSNYTVKRVVVDEGKQEEAPDGSWFCCTIGTCKKRYTTKIGLSHHVLLSHRQGTFREGGWDCTVCPRSFDREKAITEHRRLHEPGATAYVCPDCKAFFPGPASARMHINASHSAFSETYPITCRYCEADGIHPVPVFHTARQYSLHKLSVHVKQN